VQARRRWAPLALRAADVAVVPLAGRALGVAERLLGGGGSGPGGPGAQQAAAGGGTSTLGVVQDAAQQLRALRDGLASLVPE
jgi:hypothetical protein